MPLLSTIGAAAAKAFGFLKSLFGGYEVDNSLRFNSGSSDTLTKTFSTSGTSDKIKTFSFWIKRSTSSTEVVIVSAGSSSRDFIRFEDTGALRVRLSGGSADLITTQLFRDVSAWYHIVIAFDTPQATSSNRIKIYVNGSQVTALGTATYPSQNATIKLGTNNPNHIGNDSEQTSSYFNGYMSEFYMIDGQALDPTSFGETDPAIPSSGIWIPKAYTGTFGTNGFYQKYANSAALGTDSSGNGNNFTVNNLTSVDQSTDTPTNNFSTMNPLNYTPSAITYTEGNLKLAFPASWNASISSIGVSAGKWYWEAKAVTAGNNIFYGIMTENAVTNTATPYTQIGVLCGKTTDGDKYLDTTYTAGGYGTSANGDILGFALDLDSGTKNLTITKNGAAFTGGSVNLTSNFNNVNIFAFFAGNSSSDAAGWEVNYGSPMYAGGSYTDGAGFGNFSYAVPAGFYALNTKNLANYG
jgi:hypothetical protein